MKIPFEVQIGTGKWQTVMAVNGREAVRAVTGCESTINNGTGNTGKGATYREYDMYVAVGGPHDGQVISVRVA